jgi:hypothetical protein
MDPRTVRVIRVECELLVWVRIVRPDSEAWHTDFGPGGW